MRAQEFLVEARIPRAIEQFLDSLNPDDCGVDEIGAYRIHYEGFTSDCKSSADYRRDPEAVYQQVYQDFIQREGGAQPLLQDMVGDEDFPILFSVFRRKPIKEIFDRPVKSEPAAHQSRSRFKTKAGEHNLEVFFKNTTRGLEINFSVDGRGFALDQDRGKPGSTQTLMSAINVILARLPEAVAYFKPRRVWYKSIGTDAGRVKLYNRLLPVLQRALGPEWRASTEQHPGWNLYYLDRQQKVKETAGYVTRIDSQPIGDFAKNMQTYYHTDDFSQSGQFAPGSKIPKKFTGKMTGVYAGDPLFTALYATGNASQTRYVAKYGPGQPIVYFDRKDLPKIRSRRTYLTVFDASRFKKLPTGEYFSSDPGQPVKPQEEIADPFQYIKDQGWEIRVVDDLPVVLKQLQAAKVRYGSEGMDLQESTKENKQATAQQVLAYINKTHHEPFQPGSKMHQAVMAHPRWELVQVPLLNIYIPDQEYDDMDPDYEPDADPYGRVMMVEPGHAGEVSANLIDRFPIVIDADRYIIDGNHRAWAAKYLLNRDYIQAWRPV